MRAYQRNVSVAERLDFYSMPEPNSGCQLWLGTTCSGYGRVTIFGPHREGAHIAAWELANRRRVPKGMCVCHHCDVRCCINPAHLFLGTKADNNADMDRKGRRKNRASLGSANGRAKLTDADVRAIRGDSRNPKVIGPEYGVHWSVIYHIKQRRKWKHVQ